MRLSDAIIQFEAWHTEHFSDCPRQINTLLKHLNPEVAAWITETNYKQLLGSWFCLIHSKSINGFVFVICFEVIKIGSRFFPMQSFLLVIRNVSTASKCFNELTSFLPCMIIPNFFHSTFCHKPKWNCTWCIEWTEKMCFKRLSPFGIMSNSTLYWIEISISTKTFCTCNRLICFCHRIWHTFLYRESSLDVA